MEVRWYNLLVEPKDGSNKPFLFKTENVTRDNVLICQETKHRIFARFEDVTELMKFISTVKYSHNCFYEIIRGNHPHKWYTDIDIILEDSGVESDNAKCVLPAWETVEVVKCVKSALLKLLPMIKEEDIAVSSSNGKNKHSYHIILDKWCVANKDESKAIFQMVVDEMPDRYKAALDPVVYKSIQQFRLYGSHKYESDRVKVFREDLSTWKPQGKALNEEHLEKLRFLGFLVGNVRSCNYLPSYVREKVYNYLGDDSPLEKDEVKEAMRIFRTTFQNNGVFTYLSHDKKFITLKRNSPSYCQRCQRTHENENPYLLVVGEERCVLFDCRRADPNQPKVFLGKLGEKELKPLPNVEETPKIVEKKSSLAGFTVRGRKEIVSSPDNMILDSSSDDTMKDISNEDTDTMKDSPVKIKIKKKKEGYADLAESAFKITDLRKKETTRILPNRRGLCEGFCFTS